MRILVLFAHPALEKSRVHKQLLAAVDGIAGVTVHDLYESFPDGDIDIGQEQSLLEASDLIIQQHPFYWYSTPPLLKQWHDLVLEHGWAYGAEGRKLDGKYMLSAISTGGGPDAYLRGGYNYFTIRELLAPIEQTARLCRMTYLPPYVIYGTHRMDEPAIDAAAAGYRRLVQGLADDRIDLEAAAKAESLNDVGIAPATASTETPG